MEQLEPTSTQDATRDAAAQPSVILVEDDAAVVALLKAILREEGYRLTVLTHPTEDTLRATVGQVEPEVVLLDGAGSGQYGRSWLDAAWLHERSRSVPVVMFSADARATAEAELLETPRSRDAHFFHILRKPFDLDGLLDVLERATGSVTRFDRSESADGERTAALVERLRAAGATDVHGSTRREWVTFHVGEQLSALYWSQRDGVYYVTRQAPEGQGGSMLQVGRFHDLEKALETAVSSGPHGET